MHVALIFTEKMSLRAWSDSGIVVRDSLLYERLCRRGHRVTFVTYGKADDAAFLPQGSPIRVLTRPDHMSPSRYGRLLLSVHASSLADVDIFKTHQIRGARYAAWLAFRMRKPLVTRCGYLRTIFLREQGAHWRERLRSTAEEWIAFRRADAAVLPSRADADLVRRRYGVRPDRIHVSPNWIDSDRFRPPAEPPANCRTICFVGRFVPQKQPLLLLEALRGIPDVELVMIGGGELEPEIRARVEAYGINATILDRVPNEELPAWLQRSSLFALPTLYEGSPKAVMEAMACGLPIVSTLAPGMAEVFDDGVHGRKVAPDDVQGLRDAILQLIEHPENAKAMGALGRRRILEEFSIDRAVERELALYDALMKERNP
jgi:glycosyltransferase involved in cell wall biosynthesis